MNAVRTSVKMIFVQFTLKLSEGKSFLKGSNQRLLVRHYLKSCKCTGDNIVTIYLKQMHLRFQIYNAMSLNFGLYIYIFDNDKQFIPNSVNCSELN